MNSLQTIFKIAGALEMKNTNPGLTFSNLKEEVYDNTALSILISMIATIVLFNFLILYIWPISPYVNDNKKIHLCYCCMPSFYKRKKKIFKNEKEIPSIEERMSILKFRESNINLTTYDAQEGNILRPGMLLKEEEELMMKGDLEIP